MQHQTAQCQRGDPRLSDQCSGCSGKGTHHQYTGRAPHTHHSCSCMFIISISHITFQPWAPVPHTVHLPRCHHPLQTMLQTPHLLLRAAVWPGLTSLSFHPCSQVNQAFPAKLGFAPGEGSTLMQGKGELEGGPWDGSGTMLCLIPAVDVICIHSANITRPGCTSCCHDSPNTWPWARLLPLPSFCLSAYLSCLIR